MIRILLAEDNRGDIVLVQHALEEHHLKHELYVVKDGAAAIEYVERMGKPGEPPCPDIMLLDLNLPKADGPTILNEFRKHPECLETPVIAITSSDAPQDREVMAALGVSCYFKKPSDYDAFLQLGRVVRETLQNPS